MTDDVLPYGTPDLDPNVHVDPGPPLRVRCYVRGCRNLLQFRTQSLGCQVAVLAVDPVGHDDVAVPAHDVAAVEDDRAGRAGGAVQRRAGDLRRREQVL